MSESENYIKMWTEYWKWIMSFWFTPYLVWAGLGKLPFSINQDIIQIQKIWRNGNTMTIEEKLSKSQKIFENAIQNGDENMIFIVENFFLSEVDKNCKKTSNIAYT